MKRFAMLLGSSLAFALPAQAQFLFGRLQPDVGETDGPSQSVDVSANGKVLAFDSGASNWVTGVFFTANKIVTLDLISGGIEYVSRNSAGTLLNANNFFPAISNDGRFVVFESQASNLDLGVSYTSPQVVRKDRSTGVLSLVSAGAAGIAAAGSAAGQARDVSISADGRFVAFQSDANNLVAGDAVDSDDVFVKDMDSGAIHAVSVNAAGGFTDGAVTFSPHGLSADARYVVYSNNAANVVPGVAGGTIQVYLRDRQTNTNELISTGPSGPANSQSNIAAISPNGRYVSFRSFANNLGTSGFVSRVFVRDRQTNTTTAVPYPVVNGITAQGCRESDVANNGHVIFTCFFPSGIFDQVFLHQPGAPGTPFLLSSNVSDVPGNNASGTGVSINDNGLSMAFESRATNLVSNDTNNSADVFILADAGLLDGLFADGFE